MLTKPRAALLLAAVLVLAPACSDGSSEPSAGDPSSAESTPTSPSTDGTTEDPEPSPTDTAPTESAPTESAPTESAAADVAFPGVAPATGLVVQEESVELRAPEGWRASSEVAEFSSGAHASGDASMLLIDSDLLVAPGLPQPSLEEQGATLLAGLEQRGGRYELQPPLDLAGVPAVWVKGTDSRGLQEIWINVAVEGRSIDLTVEASAAILRRDPDLFESVVNTWTWR